MIAEYKKYEFCKDVKCAACVRIETSYDNVSFRSCTATDQDCLKTAKEFHTWLKMNKFKIIKFEEEKLSCSK